VFDRIEKLYRRYKSRGEILRRTFEKLSNIKMQQKKQETSNNRNGWTISPRSLESLCWSMLFTSLAPGYKKIPPVVNEGCWRRSEDYCSICDRLVGKENLLRCETCAMHSCIICRTDLESDTFSSRFLRCDCLPCLKMKVGNWPTIYDRRIEWLRKVNKISC
jgi:hypothetical protein